MAFQISNFVSVAASIINHMRGTQTRINDFNVGSVARTMVEAPAVAIDELYQQMFNGLKEAIPVSTYNSFNFSKAAAVPASGLARVVITSSDTDTLIAAGTVFSPSTAGASYISVLDVFIAAGDTTADVLVVCSTPGVLGNLAAATTFTLTPRPSGFVSASNIASFINGLDEESEDQRKQRFIDYISTLPRGTVAALKYGAKLAILYNSSGVEIERVRAVQVVEPWVDDDDQPISLVNVYIHNGAGSTSADLIAEVGKILLGYTTGDGVKVPGWKAAGVKVVVFASDEVSLDITANVTAKAGFDKAALIATVTATLADYVRALDIGESFVFAEAVRLVKSLDGVANIVFATPTADVAPTAIQKLMPDTLTIT